MTQLRTKPQIIVGGLAVAVALMRTMPVPHAVISALTDYEYRDALASYGEWPFNPHRKSHLPLVCDDTPRNGLVEEQAARLARFLSQPVDYDCLLVHCHAGACRSVAIAAACAYYFQRQPATWFKQMGSMNCDVYHVALGALGLRDALAPREGWGTRGERSRP